MVGLLPATKGSKLAGIRTVWLEKPEEAYPPLGYAIYKSDEAQRIWKRYQDKTPYPDRRGGKTWKPFHKLDPNHLQYIIKADESVIFCSAKSGKIISMVIQNFSNNNKLLLKWLNEIIAENTDECQSVWVSGLDHTLPTNTICSLLDLGHPGVGNRRENGNGSVECRRICEIKSSEYMS